MATVIHIYIAPQRAAPMSSLPSVEALADDGLAGDRYTEAKNRKGPDYQVTLIEMEHIEEFTRVTGLALTPEMPRRNIVTRGVRLNELCGKRFRIGCAVFEGLELAEPCSLCAKRTYQDALKFFVRKGGLRARIVSGGKIQVGDLIDDYS